MILNLVSQILSWQHWAKDKPCKCFGFQEAIKSDLQITNPDDLKGIDVTMKKTFQKIRDEAVRVDKPDWMKHSKKPKHNVITAKVPVVFDPTKN